MASRSSVYSKAPDFGFGMDAMSSLSGARCFRAAAVSLALVLLSGGWPATAQFAPSQSGNSARPIVLLQSSGASVAGSASVQQTTSPQGGNTITSSVQLS